MPSCPKDSLSWKSSNFFSVLIFPLIWYDLSICRFKYFILENFLWLYIEIIFYYIIFGYLHQGINCATIESLLTTFNVYHFLILFNLFPFHFVHFFRSRPLCLSLCFWHCLSSPLWYFGFWGLFVCLLMILFYFTFLPESFQLTFHFFLIFPYYFPKLFYVALCYFITKASALLNFPLYIFTKVFIYRKVASTIWRTLFPNPIVNIMSHQN